jgi:uncharacterized protein (DUF2267 family)
MIQDFVKHLTEKAGLSAEQAQSAATATMSFLKEKLPAPVAGSVQNFFDGVKDQDWTDKAKDFAENAGDKISDLASKAKDKAEDFADKAEDFAEDALDKIKGFFGGKKED